MKWFVYNLGWVYLLLFNLFLCSNFLSFLCNSTEALITAIKPDVENSMRFIISAKRVMSQTHAGNLLAPWRKSLYFCFTCKKTLQIYISYPYNISLRSFREPFVWIKDISNILSIWTCEHLQPDDESEMFYSIQRVNRQSLPFTCSTHNWIHKNTKEELTY